MENDLKCYGLPKEKTQKSETVQNKIKVEHTVVFKSINGCCKKRNNPFFIIHREQGKKQ